MGQQIIIAGGDRDRWDKIGAVLCHQLGSLFRQRVAVLHRIHPQQDGLTDGLVVGQMSEALLSGPVGHVHHCLYLFIRHLHIAQALIRGSHSPGVHHLQLVCPCRQLLPGSLHKCVYTAAHDHGVFL